MITVGSSVALRLLLCGARTALAAGPLWRLVQGPMDRVRGRRGIRRQRPAPAGNGSGEDGGSTPSSSSAERPRRWRSSPSER